MVTTANDPVMTVSDDHRRDSQEEEATETMATKKRSSRQTTRKKVTNKHHQRSESSQQGHAGLVKAEVERLEAHGVREEFTAWCKTQTSDLTVAVETGSEEKVDLKASFVQLGDASESLRTKIRDLAGCVTMTKELGQRYGLWEQNPTETELQMLRCETEQREARSKLRMQIGRLEAEAASRVEQLNKARQIQAKLEGARDSAQ